MRVACVLNPSPEYGEDYVEHLAESLKDYDFFCLRETRWPGWWCKMGLFDPSIKGDLLYFDLDTMIVGSIDDLFIGKLTMLSDFHLPKKPASGVMYLPEDVRGAVWEEWIKRPTEHMAAHRGGGDGEFLSKHLTPARWQDELPGQIVSYKVHCKNGVPKDARIVCFHGQPRPRTLNWTIPNA